MQRWNSDSIPSGKFIVQLLQGLFFNKVIIWYFSAHAETVMVIRLKLANVIHTVVVSHNHLVIAIFWFLLPSTDLIVHFWPYLMLDLADMPQPQDGEKFCGARINYRTKEPATCCADRSDDCTFIMSDGVSTTSDRPVAFGELMVDSKLSDHVSVMHIVSEKKVTVAPITLTNACQISSQQWCPRQHLLRGCLKATQVQLSWIHFSSDIEETFHFKFEIKKCPKIFNVFKIFTENL